MKYRIIASIYDSVKMIRNKAADDYAMEVHSCSNPVWIEANSEGEAVDIYKDMPEAIEFMDMVGDCHVFCIERQS